MSMDCIGEIGETDYQDYIVTDDILKATAWLSLPDPESVVKDYIIPNKIYELLKQKDDIDMEEIYILDEEGYYTMYYLCHKGLFIIQKEN